MLIDLNTNKNIFFHFYWTSFPKLKVICVFVLIKHTESVVRIGIVHKK